MDRENVATERGEGWMHAGHGSTVVIMAMADEDEALLWDELAGLSENDQ